jgi:NADH dehydrogenase FAD-containing subunit
MKKLLLVGAGHAHLEILRRLYRHPLAGMELEVVSLGSLHHYSGMVPGYLQGIYREEEIAVRVPDLVARAGGAFVAGRAVGVCPAAR